MENIMKLKTQTAFAVVSVVTSFAACGDNKNNPDAKVTIDAKSIDAKNVDAANPAIPTLGAQVDRLGRPAINTALTHAFDKDAAAAIAGKNAYNADKDPAHWVTNVAEFSSNLGILDSLDSVCGNQLLAATAVSATRYQTLAGALADDRLYVNTVGVASAVYLAVEANATGVIPNNDVGGRRLTFDVVDTSYTLLATGGATAVTDGIARVPAKTDGTVFPYLAAPL
jgi:hypothetical protein